MVTTTKLYTAEELAQMPTDQPWELWNGELRKAPGAGLEASEIAGIIFSYLFSFVRTHDLGVVSSSDGSYILSRNADVVVVPDVAFLSWRHLPGKIRPRGYAPLRPDLAVEVRSPSDQRGDIEEKLGHYRSARVPLVRWVRPQDRTVEVYRAGRLVTTIGEDGALDGEDVLPGFQLPVAGILR